MVGEEHLPMDKKASSCQDPEIRKGPWTMEEDLILVNHIANHGECVWNTLARSAGLKRTGKSCRLRWLNYLRPDVRRGNITPEERLLIMELHSRWGNRWSKIARQLPGRTDNEIKNYWRTRIQKKLKDRTPYFDVHQDPTVLTLEENAIQMPMVGMDVSIVGPSFSSVLCVDTLNDPNQLLGSAPSSGSSDGFWTMEDLWSMQLFNNYSIMF